MLILPGWDSINGVQRWGHFFTVLGLIAFAGLVLFEVLAFAYGRREKTLIQARSAAGALDRQDRRKEARREIEGSAEPSTILQDRLKAGEQAREQAKEKL